jgi:hypothetical protein
MERDTMTTSESKKITPHGTVLTFAKVGACSATLMNILNRAFGYPLVTEETAANPLAGGIVQHGYQCGQLWGAALAAGAQAYRLYGVGPRAQAAAVNASRRVAAAFRDSNGEINCLELTDTNMEKLSGVLRYFVKGGPITCFRMAVRFAPIAFSEINSALAEAPSEVSSPRASCAAKLARSIGASEMHTVMAAGLAGGIGLSGGACGALGAAVWLTAMSNPGQITGLSADGTRVGEAIEAFLASSDHQFECTEIVGRSFNDVNDHARYVCNGGCSTIIDALAAACTPAESSSNYERLRAA